MSLISVKIRLEAIKLSNSSSERLYTQSNAFFLISLYEIVSSSLSVKSLKEDFKYLSIIQIYGLADSTVSTESFQAGVGLLTTGI